MICVSLTVLQNRVLWGTLGAGERHRKLKNEELHVFVPVTKYYDEKSRLSWVGCMLGYKTYVKNLILKKHGFQVVDVTHFSQDRGQW
jgi:hypothetical protein